ncbi:DUF6497 family protein [Pseudaestuariivita sp.]|uniref:DUF6497 family protein n=1 Tax=Pseudaestuariivita sp. TaxID=2211669 RepID=UPI00405876A6
MTGRWLGVAAAVWLASGATADVAQAPIFVPSGQFVTFQEFVADAAGEGLMYRFRFIAPDISPAGKGLTFGEVADDMFHLCQFYAVPKLSEVGPKPRQIVVSLADQATEFGASDATVTQFFEAYAVKDGLCIWEIF